MISATPALSSAPSSVVPSLVTMSWPTRAASAGSSAGSSTWLGSPGSTIGAAGVALVDDRRRRPRRATPGVVSTCAISPITGAPARARQRREDVAVLGQLDVVEPELAQLVDEQAREVELLRGARVRRRVLVRLRVDPDVAQEPLEHVRRPAPPRAATDEARGASQGRRGGGYSARGGLDPERQVAAGMRSFGEWMFDSLSANPVRIGRRHRARRARRRAGSRRPSGRAAGRTPSTSSNASRPSRTARRVGRDEAGRRATTSSVDLDLGALRAPPRAASRSNAGAITVGILVADEPDRDVRLGLDRDHRLLQDAASRPRCPCTSTDGSAQRAEVELVAPRAASAGRDAGRGDLGRRRRAALASPRALRRSAATIPARSGSGSRPSRGEHAPRASASARASRSATRRRTCRSEGRARRCAP